MLVFVVAIGSALWNLKRGIAVAASPAASVGPLRAILPPPANADHFNFYTLWLDNNPQPDLGIHAQAAYLVDLDTRMVMWERDPESMRPPASLTKMVTAMVAVDDAGSLDKTIEVPKAATEVFPSLMGLTAGEHLTVREVLYGLFLPSGNDAAETLASSIVPRDRFIRQMNQKAKAIGLTSTHFVNPTGFDEPGHGMSAHDLARVAGYLDEYYPELAAIAATKDEAILSTETHKAYYPHNLNLLLWDYPGATGLKTGLTDGAGSCVVATATRDGRHLVAVTMNDNGHTFGDAEILLDYGFSKTTPVSLGSLKSP